MSVRGEELQIFRDSVRRFVEREVAPHVDGWEEQGNFPSSIFRKLGDNGFLGILVDESWGGVGGSYSLAGAWCEEFGRVRSVGFTTAVNMHSVVVTAALARVGTEAAKEAWLRQAVSGEKIGAYAFTEPGAGSDLASIQTRAVRDGSDYIINGAKTFITNGARADFVLVLAKTEPDRGYGGFTTFVVDAKTPGFSVSRKLSKLGWHASDTAELTFADMRVPGAMMLGNVNEGWYRAMESLNWERMMLTLNALGGAKACLEQTVQYVNDRKVFGRSIGKFDQTRHVLSTLSSQLRAGESYCDHILQLLDDGVDCVREAALAKLYVCELAIEVADRCLQLHGGYGYTTEFSPERWLRDLRLNTIGGGTSEVMRTIALKELGLLARA
ncbi:MAG: acyl-CoA dehydrogenase family protein [Bdellovibrionales bacterium]|nr:acyl-CoA dehydrogenase family protein [Bdellovibrionales bacterium]